MTKILFVCHGNICRSPMAEYVMKDLVRQLGREDEFVIASAATSREELGNPVYPPARRKLAEHGIRCDGHAARQMTRKDYEEFGYLIGMDRMNLSNMARICGGDPEGKCSLLLAHAGQSVSISGRSTALLLAVRAPSCGRSAKHTDPGRSSACCGAPAASGGA